MMEESDHNPGVENDAPATPVSPGGMLRAERERLGLSIADVAAQTRLATRQIEALEADDFAQLPEMPFVRGFVRNYAKLLHLDAQPLLAALPQGGNASGQAIPASVEVPFHDPRAPQRQNLIWLGAALLLSVVVVAFAVWHYTTPFEHPAGAEVEGEVTAHEAMQSMPVAQIEATTPDVPAMSETTAMPSEAAPVNEAATQPPKPAAELPPQQAAQSSLPKVSPTSGQSGQVRLVFDDESWVEVRDKDGNILSSQINARGSELRLEGATPLSLVIARASSVLLYYRGKPVDLTPHTHPSSGVARLTLD